MQQKLTESPNPWKAAMEEACIVNWCEFHEDDPVKTLHSIVCQDIAFALDPCISSDAQALIDRGRKEALEEFGLGETDQPSLILDSESNALVDYCGDYPAFYDLGEKLIKLIRLNGFEAYYDGNMGTAVIQLLHLLKKPADDLDIV